MDRVKNDFNFFHHPHIEKVMRSEEPKIYKSTFRKSLWEAKTQKVVMINNCIQSNVYTFTLDWND